MTLKTVAFDLVLLGPTGYTGKLCAEHIVRHLPSDLKWALAGRSATKVEAVAKELYASNPDRTQPEILNVQLNKEELHSLAQKTRIILNCIGPYHLHSAPVVEACASNGTHYVDVTGETPWVKEMIERYHETAKATGAIIIPCLGIESAVTDILAWSLVKTIRGELSVGTREITGSMHTFKTSGPSGGSLATIFSAIETAKVSSLYSMLNPFLLAVPPPPEAMLKQTIAQAVLGVRSVPDLGILTTNPVGTIDAAIVYRSSTLMRGLYGPRFTYRQLLRVRNAFIGVVYHWAIIMGSLLLFLPPVRWLLRQLVHAPGQGPRKEDAVNDMAEYRAVALADQDIEKPQRAIGTLSYRGDLYQLAGLLLSEGAMVVLKHEDEVRKISGGGFVTPATLGQHYIDRLEKVGCHIKAELLDG